jgi:hypothetical protein
MAAVRDLANHEVWPTKKMRLRWHLQTPHIPGTLVLLTSP